MADQKQSETAGVDRALALFDRLSRSAAYVASAALVALMALVCLAVAMRRVAGDPMSGWTEIAGLLLLVTVFLALPYCGRTGGHIAVDAVTGALPPRLNRWAEVAARLSSAVMLGILSWRGSVLAAAPPAGEVTNILEVPFAPFLWVMTVGSALYAAALAVEAVAFAVGRSYREVQARPPQ